MPLCADSTAWVLLPPTGRDVPTTWPTDFSSVSIGIFRGVREDEWNINTSRIMGVDATDPDQLSRAEMEGREQVQQIFRFLRKYVPGCENAVLLSTPAHIGVRETRHIKGEYILTTDDVLHGVLFDDSILLAANSIDVHGRFGPMSNEYVTVENGEYYGVPYRCLVPLKVENLLVAGRSVSATSEAAGAIRVMPPAWRWGRRRARQPRRPPQRTSPPSRSTCKPCATPCADRAPSWADNREWQTPQRFQNIKERGIPT